MVAWSSFRSTWQNHKLKYQGLSSSFSSRRWSTHGLCSLACETPPGGQKCFQEKCPCSLRMFNFSWNFWDMFLYVPSIQYMLPRNTDCAKLAQKTSLSCGRRPWKTGSMGLVVTIPSSAVDFSRRRHVKGQIQMSQELEISCSNRFKSFSFAPIRSWQFEVCIPHAIDGILYLNLQHILHKKTCTAKADYSKLQLNMPYMHGCSLKVDCLLQSMRFQT